MEIQIGTTAFKIAFYNKFMVWLFKFTLVNQFSLVIWTFMEKEQNKHKFPNKFILQSKKGEDGADCIAITGSDLLPSVIDTSDVS